MWITNMLQAAVMPRTAISTFEHAYWGRNKVAVCVREEDGSKVRVCVLACVI